MQKAQTCAREEVHGATQGIPAWAHRLGAPRRAHLLEAMPTTPRNLRGREDRGRSFYRCVLLIRLESLVILTKISRLLYDTRSPSLQLQSVSCRCLGGRPPRPRAALCSVH